MIGPAWLSVQRAQKNAIAAMRQQLAGESRVPPTERYQATVPQPVRQALGLRKRDRIRYTMRANGEVVLQRVNAEPADDDPALAPFLALLEQDIASHPERLQPVTAELADRLQELVGGITVDLDGPPREEDDSISNLPSKHTV